MLGKVERIVICHWLSCLLSLRHAASAGPEHVGRPAAARCPPGTSSLPRGWARSSRPRRSRGARAIRAAAARAGLHRRRPVVPRGRGHGLRRAARHPGSMSSSAAAASPRDGYGPCPPSSAGRSRLVRPLPSPRSSDPLRGPAAERHHQRGQAERAAERPEDDGERRRRRRRSRPPPPRRARRAAGGRGVLFARAGLRLGALAAGVTRAASSETTMTGARLSSRAARSTRPPRHRRSAARPSRRARPPARASRQEPIRTKPSDAVRPRQRTTETLPSSPCSTVRFQPAPPRTRTGARPSESAATPRWCARRSRPARAPRRRPGHRAPPPWA